MMSYEFWGERRCRSAGSRKGRVKMREREREEEKEGKGVDRYVVAVD